MTLVDKLFESDEASALTNQAARRIEALEKALRELVNDAEHAAVVFDFNLCDEPIAAAKTLLDAE